MKKIMKEKKKEKEKVKKKIEEEVEEVVVAVGLVDGGVEGCVEFVILDAVTCLAPGKGDHLALALVGDRDILEEAGDGGGRLADGDGLDLHGVAHA